MSQTDSTPTGSLVEAAAIEPVHQSRLTTHPVYPSDPAVVPDPRIARAVPGGSAEGGEHGRTPASQTRLPLEFGPLPAYRLHAGEKPSAVSREMPDALQAELQGIAGMREVLPISTVDRQDSAPPAKSEPHATAVGPRWARPIGHTVIRISDLVFSPYRARLPPDPGSLRPLADSLASSVQPIQPVFVRRKGERWELLDGHRITLAGQHYLGWTEVLAVILDIPDDVEAAYWVVGSNCAHEKVSKWELMRAVRILLAVSPGDEKRTQRKIARRNGWREQDVSEAKFWGRVITASLLEMAGVDEATHSAALKRFTRDDLRDIRWAATDEERVAILRRLVLGPRESPGTTSSPPEAEDLFDAAMVGSTWRVEVVDLAERTGSELRVICRRMVQRLKAEHGALRDPG